MLKLYKRFLAWLSPKPPAPVYVPPKPTHKTVSVSRQFEHEFVRNINEPWYWDETAYERADILVWPSALKELKKKLPNDFKSGLPSQGVDVEVIPLSQTRANVVYSVKVKL
jgi:hypothetical protein